MKSLMIVILVISSATTTKELKHDITLDAVTPWRAGPLALTAGAEINKELLIKLLSKLLEQKSTALQNTPQLLIKHEQNVNDREDLRRKPRGLLGGNLDFLILNPQDKSEDYALGLIHQISMNLLRQDEVKSALFSLAMNIADQMLSESVRNRTEMVVKRLEDGEDIQDLLFALITKAFDMDVIYGNLMRALASEYTSEWNGELLQTTRKLQNVSGWSTKSSTEKLIYIVLNFNYTKYGDSIIQKFYYNFLARSSIMELMSFIDDIQRSSSVASVMKSKLPMVEMMAYKLLLAIRPNMTTPQSPVLTQDVLDELGFYEALDQALFASVKKIVSGEETRAMWFSKSTNVTDLHRLVLVFSNMNYSKLSSRLLDNFVDTLKDPEQSTRLFIPITVLVCEAIGLSNSSQQFLSGEVVAMVGESLSESAMSLSDMSLWDGMSGTGRLRAVVAGVNYKSLGIKFLSALTKHEEGLLPADVKLILELFSPELLLLFEDKLIFALETQLDQWMWHSQTPPEAENITRSFAEVLIPAIAIQYKMFMNKETNFTAKVMNLTGTLDVYDFSSGQRLVFSLISMDWQQIFQGFIEKLMALLSGKSYLILQKLEAGESLKEELQRIILLVPFISIEQRSWLENVTKTSTVNNLIQIIDQQLLYTYKDLSSSEYWRVNNYSPNMKIGDLVSRFDLKLTGYTLLVKVITRLYTEIHDITGVNPHNFLPVQNLVYLEQKKQENLNNSEWRFLPDELKLPFLLAKLNDTLLYAATKDVAMNFATDTTFAVLTDLIPTNYTGLMNSAVEAFDNSYLSEWTLGLIQKALGDNSILNMVLDREEVKSIINAVCEPIQKEYNRTHHKEQEAWMGMRPLEKLARVALAVNISEVAGDVVEEVSQILESSRKYYTAVFNPAITDLCRSDLSYLLTEISGTSDTRIEAIRMLDSWGKIPAGMVEGQMLWPGDMKECELIKLDRVTSDSNGETTLIEEDAIQGSWAKATFDTLNNPILGEVRTSQGKPLSLVYGFCLPKSCQYSDHYNIINSVFNLTGMKLERLVLKADYPIVKEEYKADPVFIAAVSFFAILGSVWIVATAIDRFYFMRSHEGKESKLSNKIEIVNSGYTSELAQTEMQETTTEVFYLANGNTAVHMEHPAEQPEDSMEETAAVKIVKAFSLYQTVPALFDTETESGWVKALDSIRFFSMTWLILGHTYATPVHLEITENMNMFSRTFASNGDWTAMSVFSAMFGVDSFLFISGLLVGLKFLKKMHQIRGRITFFHILKYLLHRYIRFLPLYGGVILLVAGTSRYWGVGPFFTWEPDSSKEGCRSLWWTNFLFVNNIIEPRKMCVPWSWYLALDMQFYIIAPLILIPLYLYPVVGKVILSMLILAHMAVTAIPFTKLGSEGLFSGNTDTIYDIYMKPQYRIGAYLMGLALAYGLFRKVQIKRKLTKLMMWLVTFGLIFIYIYMPYFGNEGDNTVQRTVFEATCRTAWGLILAWTVFACNNNCAGIIGDLLNWRGWRPLARLTFAAFLLHPAIVTIWLFNQYQLIYMEKFNLAFVDMSFILSTYLSAGIFYVMLEAPIANIKNIILCRQRNILTAKK